jgi:hypothetical protein
MVIAGPAAIPFHLDDSVVIHVNDYAQLIAAFAGNALPDPRLRTIYRRFHGRIPARDLKRPLQNPAQAGQIASTTLI